MKNIKLKMATKEQKKKFVYARKAIVISGETLVEKDAVGIVVNSNPPKSEIFFVRAWINLFLDSAEFKSFDVSKTGDQFPKKICNICHRLMKTDNFDKNQNGINNRSVRRPSCHDCRKELDGVKMSNETRQKWNKTKPINIPYECPICCKRTIAGITSKVVLDHNHKNGQARGWVCDSCNTGIGRFKDNQELIKRAIKHIS